jgi:hypothetical protein
MQLSITVDDNPENITPCWEKKLSKSKSKSKVVLELLLDLQRHNERLE